ncbi:unnamed protein product [Parnassius apollo]|uniref:(apollo) hypothetical protein n=1 Tax=Parnassius apollo TaxID=110799 RepID=A0A8S3XDG9_PARAO|nr:unnamed protein product [Parnassius apollo]
MPRTGDNSNTPVKPHSEESSPVDNNNYCLNITTRKTDSSKGGLMQDRSLEARTDILNSFKEELPLLLKAAVKSELNTLKNQISTIETTLNFISTQYEENLRIACL